MKRAFGLGVFAMAASASLAATPYAGTFDYNWDFNNGTTQGWALNGGAAMEGGNHLYLPDASYAVLDTASLGLSNLGGNASQKGYIMQVDVTIPATNFIQGSGIGMYRGSAAGPLDWKGPTLAGGPGSNYGTGQFDKSWDNTNHNYNYNLESGGTTVPITVTLQMDYGYSTPGKFFAWVKSSVANDRGAAANTWSPLNNAAGGGWDVHPSDTQRWFAIGGSPGASAYNASWTQARFDNVRLEVIPEPATFGLLGRAAAASK